MNNIKNNVKYLNLIARHAPSVNRAKIEGLADALQTKKLTKYKDVEKVALMLSTKSPSAERAYNKLMGITAPEIAPPVRGAKKGPRQKEWTITIMLYTDRDKLKKDDDVAFVPDDDFSPVAATKNNKYLNTQMICKIKSTLRHKSSILLKKLVTKPIH